MSRRVAYGLVIVGALALAALLRTISFDFLIDRGRPDTAPVAAPSLSAGDCINTDLEPVSRIEPHFGEVFFTADYPGDVPFPQPDDRYFQQWTRQHCHDRFARYVGIAVERSGYDLRVLLRPRSWSSTRRPVFCTVANVDSSPLMQSVKGIAR
jgi:hypothetical protein